jgi:hypothetical protein
MNEFLDLMVLDKSDLSKKYKMKWINIKIMIDRKNKKNVDRTLNKGKKD